MNDSESQGHPFGLWMLGYLGQHFKNNIQYLWCEIEVLWGATGINRAYWAAILRIKQVIWRLASVISGPLLVAHSTDKAHPTALYGTISASECVCLPMDNGSVSINPYGDNLRRQASIQLSVEGSKADMWANVLARQPAASGRVHDDNNPNLMLEPQTGSIYMKNKNKKNLNQKGREWQNEALSKVFQFDPPSQRNVENRIWGDWRVDPVLLGQTGHVEGLDGASQNANGMTETQPGMQNNTQHRKRSQKTCFFCCCCSS